MPKRKHKSSELGEFSLDDCNALLKYTTEDFRLQLKRETSVPDLPELGSLASLVLNVDDTCSTATTISQQSEHESEPEDPQAIETALSLNKTLQQKLVQSMNQIHEALAKNKLKQSEILKMINKEDKSTEKKKVKKPIGLFSAPYFRDTRGMCPPDNEDTREKIKNHDVTSYLPPPKPWHLWEKDKLINGIGASALSYVLKPYKTKRDFLKNKIKSPKVTDEDVKALKREIVQLERHINEECKRPYRDLINEAGRNIDWMTVAASHMEGSRTEEECEMMWKNYLSVSVNKGTFTRDEDARLQRLVEEHNEKEWDAVAEELKTNRSAIQCFERYQTKFNKTIMKKNWTPEEDKQLLKLINMFKVGNFIPWNKVCNYMEGRGRVQVLNRYERTISEEISRAPWSKEEDAMLLACVSRFGQQWQRMQPFFTGRPTYSCRERYVNTLEKGLKIGAWTKAEDVKLIELIKQHGYGKWSRICPGLPGRTDNNCMVRAKRLEIHSLEKFKHKLKGRTEISPDALASILEPLAPSKNCKVQNIRLRYVQDTAKDTLKKALKNIGPSLEEPINLETLDLSTAGVGTLRLLYKELQRSQKVSLTEPWTPRYVDLPRKQLKRVTRSKKRIVEQENEANDSADDCYYCDTKPDVNSDDEVEPDEKFWIKKLLESKFEEQTAKAAFATTSVVSLINREQIECNLYETFLSQALKCSKEEPPDEENLTFGGVDYNVSLASAVRYFVQPPVPENEDIILAPNTTTFDALAIMQSSDQRLRRTADFVNHSISYVRYLTENIGSPPQCVQCHNKKHCPAPSEKQAEFESAVQSMKTSMLVVDDAMNMAAMQETRFSSYNDPNTTCQCAALAKSKASVELLNQRFISLFLWPYLFSSLQPDEEQEKLMLKSQPIKYPEFKPRISKENGIKKSRATSRLVKNKNWKNRKTSDVIANRKEKVATEVSDSSDMQEMAARKQQAMGTQVENATNSDIKHPINIVPSTSAEEHEFGTVPIKTEATTFPRKPRKSLCPKKCRQTSSLNDTDLRSEGTLRRSSRSCVLKRKSFIG